MGYLKRNRKQIRNILLLCCFLVIGYILISIPRWNARELPINKKIRYLTEEEFLSVLPEESLLRNLTFEDWMEIEYSGECKDVDSDEVVTYHIAIRKDDSFLLSVSHIPENFETASEYAARTDSSEATVCGTTVYYPLSSSEIAFMKNDEYYSLNYDEGRAEELEDIITDILYQLLGEENRGNNVTNQNSADVYAYGKDSTILTKDVLQAKEYYMAGGLNEAEAEAKAVNYTMEREALYNAAIRSGYSVTDQEVREYVAELKDLLEASDHYDMVLEVMDSFDSEEAYWEYQCSVYQKNLPIQKYVQALQLEFQNSFTTASNVFETNDSGNNYTDLWNDYYNSHKQTLVEQQDYSLNNNISE